MAAIRLVVGLGNPGREYEETRHNAGFWWVDRLAGQFRASWALEARFFSLLARIRATGGDECWLLKPQTFMNGSGRAVAALARFYRIPPEQVLVVHDELDLPPGVARLKKGGGAGGHNGLKDIGSQLQTPDYWRLRLGIGHPGDRAAVTGFVLHAPGRDERARIEGALDRSLELAGTVLAGDMERAMRCLHASTSGKGLV